MEDLVKDAIVKLATQQVLKFLASKIPFLGGGIVGWIAGIFISKVLRIAVEQTILGAKIGMIDYAVNKETKAFKEAWEEYEKDEDEEGVIDAEYKIIKETKVINAARELMDFT